MCTFIYASVHLICELRDIQTNHFKNKRCQTANCTWSDFTTHISQQNLHLIWIVRTQRKLVNHALVKRREGKRGSAFDAIFLCTHWGTQTCISVDSKRWGNCLILNVMQNIGTRINQVPTVFEMLWRSRRGWIRGRLRPPYRRGAGKIDESVCKYEI